MKPAGHTWFGAFNSNTLRKLGGIKSNIRIKKKTCRSLNLVLVLPCLTGRYLASGLYDIEEFLGLWGSVPLARRAWFGCRRRRLRGLSRWRRALPVSCGGLWGLRDPARGTVGTVVLSWKNMRTFQWGVRNETDLWVVQLTWRKKWECERVQRWTGQAEVCPLAGLQIRKSCRRSLDHVSGRNWDFSSGHYWRKSFYLWRGTLFSDSKRQRSRQCR